MDAWVRLRPGVYVVATNIAAAQLRDLLGGVAYNIQVLVAQLTGAWGTVGMNEVANWMAQVKRAF
jgi:hypothetical protein